MRITDETARVISEHIKKYAGKQLSDARGQHGPVIAEFISILFRTQRTKRRTFLNGRPTQEEECRAKNGLLMLAYAGENLELGSGEGTGCVELIGYSPEIVDLMIFENLDDIVKNAGEMYFKGTGQRIISTQPKSLTPIGTRKRIVYRQQIPPEDFPLLEHRILQSVQPILRKGLHVETELEITDEESIFENSYGSDIRQRNELVTIEYTVHGLDIKNKPLERHAKLYFSSSDAVKERILKRRIEQLLKEFHAARRPVSINSGDCPVLLDGSATAVLFHEAMVAHLVSGKYLMLGKSTVYGYGRLHTQVMPEWLTLIDNPALKGWLGSYKFDEEGIRARKAVLVDRGILQGYLHDAASATWLSRKVGEDIPSNGRARSSWPVVDEEAVFPEPRVTNLVVEVDERYLLAATDLKEQFLGLIQNSQAGCGLFVEGGGGGVKIEDGQFILEPGNVWRVSPRGKYELVVPEPKLSGDSGQLIDQIVAMGKPPRSDFGRCGAESGWVTTQGRSPAALMRGLTAIAHPEDTTTPRLDYQRK